MIETDDYCCYYYSVSCTHIVSLIEFRLFMTEYRENCRAVWYMLIYITCILYVYVGHGHCYI